MSLFWQPGKATGFISKTYFGNENYDFSLLKLQRKNDHFVESSLYRYPSVFYRGSCEKIEKRSNKFFSKIRRFLTPNRILMFENTSPTLLDTRDVFRIRFWYNSGRLTCSSFWGQWLGFSGFNTVFKVFRKTYNIIYFFVGNYVLDSLKWFFK